jgi:hypothetical protein
MAGDSLRALLRILLVVLFVLGTGCADDGETLARWTLVDAAGGTATQVSLPAHVGGLVGRSERFELQCHVPLDPAMRAGPVTLSIAWLPARVSLRVDGVAVDELDHPLTDRFRSAGAHRWHIPDELLRRGEIDLDLRIENAWTQATWLDTPPRLSRTEGGNVAFLATAAFDQASAVTAFVTIALLTLLYFALYLRDRRRVQYGFFALEGLGALPYPAVMAGLAQPVLGRGEVAVGGAALALSAVATVHFTSSYLGLPRPSRGWWVALGVVGIAAVFRGGPFDATPWVVPATVALVLANAGYQLATFARLARTKSRPTNLSIVTLSWPVAVVFATSDFVGWLGLGDPFGGLRAGSLGIASVAVLQSIALAGEHIQSLRQAELLNEELRHQVAARSRDLAEALARLGAASGAPVELKPGDAVEDRYRVVRLLGHGAGGRVY